MIRIHIDWDYTSPLLGIASGIVSIDNFENNLAAENILKCKVKIERGSIGFSSIDTSGVSTKLFELFHDQLSQMAHSYHKGMLLEDYDFYWYEEEINWRNAKKNKDDIIYIKKESHPKKGA